MAERRRKPKKIRVSPDSGDGWWAFSRAHGVTMSSMAEVLGFYLRQFDDPTARLPKWLAELKAEAATIAANRRDRPGADD